VSGISNLQRHAAAIIFCAAFFLEGRAAANADACSDTWFYASMAASGERDLTEYIGEGGSQTARSDFDLIVRNVDKATLTVDACKQADTLAKYAFVDADRWQIGFERGWITAPDAARRIHADLGRLKAIHFDRRDMREYDSLQIEDKSLFQKAGYPWQPVR
jgi:hypothetical protein